MTSIVKDPMTKAECRLWIVALRSGKYKQGQKRLCTIYGEQKSYCCLGVAAEVLRIETIQPYWSYLFDATNDVAFKLPTNTQHVLAVMNDTQRSDFNYIASHIEQHILPTLSD